MDFRHFVIFLKVCEVSNMTRAAKAMYMTQPSVSQAISELERYYNVKLFDRLSHRLYITPAGESLRSYASHIISLADQAKKDLTRINAPGSLRLGASLTIGAYLLPKLIQRFQQETPDVELFSMIDNTRIIEKWILEDQLDLGIVEGPLHSSQVVEEALYDDELIFICPPSHPYAAFSSVKVGDLAGQAFIIREEGSGTRELFENAMLSKGIKWKTAGIYNNNEAIISAVKNNLGVAVVSKYSVETEILHRSLAALSVDDVSMRRKFNLIYHRHKYFTKVMQAFIDCIKRQ